VLPLPMVTLPALLNALELSVPPYTFHNGPD
jgi:hypothetical protein